jgi:hypothetical protein
MRLWVLVGLACLLGSSRAWLFGGGSDEVKDPGPPKEQDPLLLASEVRGIPKRDEAPYVGLRFR